MEATIAVTSKWQIHIPKAMRLFLGTKRPGQVKIKAINSRTPAEFLQSLKLH